ncbi:mechanosensitive ion channel domain-containing protein [candidate division CSSED10-310 bacterium]|uniref:Mechanosensitive ion channel domain-containing protein n=1 Tax=candidate division CSSED10-310 bacterium TaxID=2855610 RepID=A0ABV6YWY9_UNCC1
MKFRMFSFTIISIFSLSFLLPFSWGLQTPIVQILEPIVSPTPEISSLIRISELRTNRKELEEMLVAHTDLTSFSKKYAEIVADFAFIEERLKFMQETNSYGFGHVIELRGKIWQAGEKLKRFNEDISARFDLIKSLQKFWQNEEKTWSDIEKIQVDESEIETNRKVLEEGKLLTNSALLTIRNSLPPVVKFQGDVSDLLIRSQNLFSELDALLKRVRGEMFRRNAVFMFSIQYIKEFNGALFKSFFNNITQINLFETQFFALYGWLLILQVILTAILVYLIRKKRGALNNKEFWELLTLRPWSSGIFIAIFLFVPIFSSLPSSWRLLFWILASITTIRIMTEHLNEQWQKRLVILILTPFIISLIFKVIELPAPLFRLYIACVALVGFPLSFRLASSIRKTERPKFFYLRILQLGGIILLFVFLAQVVGFSVLANHLFDSAVKSVFLFLFGYMFVQFARRGIIFFVTFPFFQKIAAVERHKEVISQRIVFVLRIIVAVLVFVTFLTIWGIYDSPLQAWHSLIALGITIGQQKVTFGLVFFASIVLLVTFYTSRAVQSILTDEVFPRKQIASGLGVSINRLVHYSLIIIGFFWFISILGFNLQNIAIIGGALGIGIGFGLQNIVSNFVSGLVLLVERPVKVGDVVVVNETWGEILKLGLRSTVISTYDRSEIIIPNSDLITNQVVNWTRLNRSARLKISVGVAYGSDVPKVMSILKDVAVQHPLTLPDPAPKVHFLGFGDSSLNFELWLWLADLSDRFPVRTQLLREIDNRFNQEGIVIPFPQRDIHIKTVPRKKKSKTEDTDSGENRLQEGSKVYNRDD